MPRYCEECKRSGAKPKQGSFQRQDGKGEVRCMEHKKPGMVAVNGLCAERECHKKATFGLPFSKKRLYCRTHAKRGMIDLHHPSCGRRGCRTQAKYGFKGDRPKSCTHHKEVGMICLDDHKKCTKRGCGVQPKFGYKGGSRKVCFQHQAPGMVNLDRLTDSGKKRAAGSASPTIPAPAPVAAKKCRVSSFKAPGRRRSAVVRAPFASIEGKEEAGRAGGDSGDSEADDDSDDEPTLKPSKRREVRKKTNTDQVSGKQADASATPARRVGGTDPGPGVVSDNDGNGTRAPLSAGAGVVGSSSGASVGAGAGAPSLPAGSERRERNVFAMMEDGHRTVVHVHVPDVFHGAKPLLPPQDEKGKELLAEVAKIDEDGLPAGEAEGPSRVSRRPTSDRMVSRMLSKIERTSESSSIIRRNSDINSSSGKTDHSNNSIQQYRRQVSSSATGSTGHPELQAQAGEKAIKVSSSSARCDINKSSSNSSNSRKHDFLLSPAEPPHENRPNFITPPKCIPFFSSSSDSRRDDPRRLIGNYGEFYSVRRTVSTVNPNGGGENIKGDCALAALNSDSLSRPAPPTSKDPNLGALMYEHCSAVSSTLGKDGPTRGVVRSTTTSERSSAASKREDFSAASKPASSCLSFKEERLVVKSRPKSDGKGKGRRHRNASLHDVLSPPVT